MNMSNMKAKKSLGQNFLKSALALKEIVKAGEIVPTDIILEIGPGKGALTTKLLETGATVIAVEKDRDLFAFLSEKFKENIDNNKLILKNDDILEFQFTKREITSVKYKVIANIPYNITGAILKKFLTGENQPETMVLMVQHEVAKRIVAGDGKESLLSIGVKAYGTPKMVMKVPARYFSPAPKVDSAVISIKGISRKFFKDQKIDENKFWELVHAGFAHKRKQIGKNIKKFVSVEAHEKFKNKRAEDLNLNDWVILLK